MDSFDALLRDSAAPAATGGFDVGSVGVGFAGGGGVELGRTRKYAVVVLSAQDGICGGYRQHGSVICLKNPDDCNHDHTGEGFLDLSNGDVIVIKRDDNGAFAAPTLPYMDHMFWFDSVDKMELPIREWKNKFTAVLHAEADDVSQVADQESQMAKTLNMFKTPIAKKKRSASYAEEAYSPYVGTSLESLQDAPDGPPVQWTGIFAQLDSAVKELSAWSYDEHVEGRSILNELQDAVAKVFVKVSTVQSTIGSPAGIPDDYEHPTLWGSLGLVIDRISAQPSVPVSSNSAPVEPVVDALLTQRGLTQPDIEGMMIVKVTELHTKVGGILANVLARLKSVESRPTSSGNFPMGGTPNVAPQVSILEGKFKALEIRTDANEKTLVALKGDRDASTCRFGSTGINSAEQAQKWLLNKYPKGTFGNYLDFISLMQFVDVTYGGSQEQLLGNMKKRRDMDILNPAEAKVLMALEGHRPALLFHGDVNPDKTDPSHLTAVKSQAQWFHHQTGLATKIKERTQSVYAEVSSRIYKEPVKHAVAKALATEMLAHTLTFTTSAIQWSRTMFDELTQINKFSEAKAFALVTQCFARMVDDMLKARGQPFDSIGAQSGREGIAAEVLHASLRVHDVMHEYLDANFSDHRSVSAEYIKFLAVNSGFDAVSQLVDKSTALAEENKRLRQQVQSAEKKADTASNRCDQFAKTLKELSKEMDHVKRVCKKE
ncbi:MAG: hypothetical protein SGILL_004402 [Bacillariaceae sp.]